MSVVLCRHLLSTCEPKTSTLEVNATCARSIGEMFTSQLVSSLLHIVEFFEMFLETPSPTFAPWPNGLMISTDSLSPRIIIVRLKVQI